MFCSQCGMAATGKFCHQCGSPLAAAAEDVLVLRDEDFEPEAGEWEQFTRYDQIVRVEAVRTVIADHAAAARKGLSGEAVLALYDKVVESPVPLEKLAAVLQPLYASWGVRTGKERSEDIAVPIGRAIARALCSLARQSQAFEGAEQHPAGCVLTAELPSSVCALKGKLIVALIKRDQRTRVRASTDIPGQMYDWGKSQRCLETLFRDLHSDMGLPPRPGRRHVA
jgi:hypothetical protein